ncbi:hypothetical protein BpHYR1_023208 [Brachionus plicatilis]|uniref:Uncharacterized protein n=1 Tax=Brachionus plicatilis TaxID=10195 RepID=A0A3M7PU08_BRAPC|nr:hypothetical protein BpHYR1_023208 [Brachionus plicatilis]
MRVHESLYLQFSMVHLENCLLIRIFEKITERIHYQNIVPEILSPRTMYKKNSLFIYFRPKVIKYFFDHLGNIFLKLN